MQNCLAATIFLLACQPLTAQAPTAAGESAQERAAERGGIAWFGTWQQGLAEAQRTGKPILLMSAVPQCHNVPGVW